MMQLSIKPAPVQIPKDSSKLLSVVASHEAGQLDRY